jgi:hypothetical protein
MKPIKRVTAATFWSLSLLTAGGCTSVYPPDLSVEEKQTFSAMEIVLRIPQKGIGVSYDHDSGGNAECWGDFLCEVLIEGVLLAPNKKGNAARKEAASEAAKRYRDRYALIDFNAELASKLEDLAQTVDWLDAVHVVHDYELLETDSPISERGWWRIRRDLIQHLLNSPGDLLVALSVKYGLSPDMAKVHLELRGTLYAKSRVDESKAMVREVSAIKLAYQSPSLDATACDPECVWEERSLNHQLRRGIDHVAHMLAMELNGDVSYKDDKAPSRTYDGNLIHAVKELPLQIRHRELTSVPPGVNAGKSRFHSPDYVPPLHHCCVIDEN